MASKSLKFWLGLFLVGIYGLPAQNLRMDSLQKLLKKLPDGKDKVAAINELAFDYIFYSYDTSMKYANEAEDLAVRINYPVGKALSLNISGIVYRIQGNYSRALDSHLQSLRICEQENYSQGIANNFSNIGLVYYDKEDYKKALEYFEKALKIKEEIKDLRGVAFSLNDIGGVYLRLGNLEKAQLTYLKSIQVREKIGDQQGLATSLNNLGRLYLEKGELKKALNYLQRSIKVGRTFNDQLSIAITLNNIAEVHFKQGDFEKAKQSHLQALQIARSINSKIEIRNAYLGLARCHQQLEEYAAAFGYLETYIALKDSLSNEENNKRVASLEYGYKLEIKDIELKRQSLIQNALIGGAILIIVALLFIIRAIRQKRGAYQLLKAQKTEIEQQRDNMAAQKQALEQAYQEITRQNQQITSSVAYARNIQRALLPDQELKAYFDKYYVINRPQFDVSGDFYWFRELKGKHFFGHCRLYRERGGGGFYVHHQH
ncbi:MAG: tetratricopeptide repeat protein [Microscillaceae bacterium]|nr:tetratricopeptide repeat protein [Microscillaceae bacterium]